MFLSSIFAIIFFTSYWSSLSFLPLLQHTNVWSSNKIKLIPSLLHTESFILSLFFTLQFQLRTPNAQPECKPLKWSWGLNANSHFGPFFFSSLLFLSHRNIEWPRCENNKNKPASHVWSGRGGRSAKQPGSFFIQHKDVLNFFHPVNKRRPIKTITFVTFVSVLRGAIKPFNTLNIGGTHSCSNKPQRKVVWLKPYIGVNFVLS